MGRVSTRQGWICFWRGQQSSSRILISSRQGQMGWQGDWSRLEWVWKGGWVVSEPRFRNGISIPATSAIQWMGPMELARFTTEIADSITPISPDHDYGAIGQGSASLSKARPRGYNVLGRFIWRLIPSSPQYEIPKYPTSWVDPSIKSQGFDRFCVDSISSWRWSGHRENKCNNQHLANDMSLTWHDYETIWANDNLPMIAGFLGPFFIREQFLIRLGTNG